MKIENVQVIASTGDEKNGFGEIQVHTFSKNEVALNALKKLGLFWGLSLFCVLIPGLHFILTPLFFIIGIYTAYKTSKINHKVVGGKVSCSQCGKDVKINVSLLSWPLTEICQNCVNTLRIRPLK